MKAITSSNWAFALTTVILSIASLATAVDHKRVVIYYQSSTTSSNKTVSLLPLIQQSEGIAATNVIISALHIQDSSSGAQLHLNNAPAESSQFNSLWSEVEQLQSKGVTVTAMLGGAAKGSYVLLDGSDDDFHKFYTPLFSLIHDHKLDGLDLDVEEDMSLNGIIRLIDQLKADFGAGFIITLAPVAAALIQDGGNLSGFSYFDLEAQRGDAIAWYNTQFYDGWADAGSPNDYEAIISGGFAPGKVVMGLLTAGSDGQGFVALDTQASVLKTLVTRYSNFGGVAGWEYFNSAPGGEAQPWKWAAAMKVYMS